MDRLRQGVAWNVVPVALLGVVGLGLNFGIGRWWGAAALGAFNQVTTAYFVMAVVAGGGLSYAVVRAVAEQPQDRDRVAAVVVGALVPTVVLALACSAVFVGARHAVAAWLESDAVATGMLWAAPGLGCFAVNKVLFAVVNGLGRMRAFAVYTSMRYLLIALGLGVARWQGWGAAELPGLWTLTEGVLLVVLLVEVVRTVALARAAGWRGWTRRHLDFAVRGVGATIFSEVNSRLDVWMLGAALADAQVGVYSMAASIADGVMQLAVVLQLNVNPHVAQHAASGRVGEIDALARQTRRWAAPLLVLACALAAGAFPLTVPWLAGSHEFMAGAAPFAVLMLGIALASPWLPMAQVLMMGGRPGWHTVLVALGVGLNVVGNLLLIPRLGLMGAAVGTASALVLSMLILRRMARWQIGARI